MPYNPKINHRRSIRLQNYDYSGPGAYFVTICVRNRSCLFGDVVDGEMRLNDTGVMVSNIWEWLRAQNHHVELDAFVVMPNHFHGIIILVDDCMGGSCMGGSRTAHTDRRKPVGRLVGMFKTVSTKQINIMRQTPGGKIWQRNYWEHIVRDEPELNRIREYIVANPVRWEMDRLHSGHELRETPAAYGAGHPGDDADWMV